MFCVTTDGQSVNQSVNFYHAMVQRCMLHCGYAESKRNILRRILNVLTDGAVRQFSGRLMVSVSYPSVQKCFSSVVPDFWFKLVYLAVIL